MKAKSIIIPTVNAIYLAILLANMVFSKFKYESSSFGRTRTTREKAKTIVIIVWRNNFHDFRLCIFFNLESGVFELVSR